jgi:hypothetical protein
VTAVLGLSATSPRHFFARAPTTNFGSASCPGGGSWIESENLRASNGTPGDFFGQSVAISGDTAVIGSAAGAAYVFVRNGSRWTEQQELTPSASAVGFGSNVAIDGDTIVVGAISDSVGSNTGQGSAYVFVRSGATWSQQRKLVASDGESFDGFGNSVGISGDTIVVGSVFDTVGVNFAQGSA